MQLDWGRNSVGLCVTAYRLKRLKEGRPVI